MSEREKGEQLKETETDRQTETETQREKDRQRQRHRDREVHSCANSITVEYEVRRH